MRMCSPTASITWRPERAISSASCTPLADAPATRVLDLHLRAIPGVVDTGLFLGTAERVLVGYPDGHVDVLALPARGEATA